VSRRGPATLAANPTTLSIAQGANGNSTITINRTGGFSASVALTHTTTAPAGVTVAFNPASTTGTTSTMTVTVGAGVAAGSYTITVKGNATGLVEQTATVTLTVQAAGTGNVAFDFCAISGLPVWFAAQDGNGPWTAVIPGAGDVYSFNITAKGGVAWVEVTGARAELMMVYGSQAELQALGSGQCTATGPTRTINGSVANLGLTEQAFVSVGNAFAMVMAPHPGSRTSR
jgi:hypothetical protein